ncbi:MAG: selenocysteine-specific translation elongation factor [Acidobacteriales bacterium]|nr:selenocysteine-specific translation elongation factor [Terriglobales bacterium]
MKSIIVGTAGHIDHGKTALVKALTGIDADRLEEEKRRGITIDIGFADLELRSPSGELLRLGFVDVPGHERFVRNMLAGVGGIDVVLLVIAAEESIKPQTREHFDICRLLSLPRGIVALTKSDLVDSETLNVVRLEVEELLRGSFLDPSRTPIVAVSSRTQAGIPELKRALALLSSEVSTRNSQALTRLPIDRVFSMKGFGTVVTGTLIAGAISTEDELEIFPQQQRVRVRGVQVYGKSVRQAIAGQRTALNLAGITVAELHRGMTLAAPATFQPTTRVDVNLTILPDSRPLADRARVHLHAYTFETVATVMLHGRKHIAAGETAFAHLRLREPALLSAGDRFIIRRFSPVTTIGGGVVLDASSPVRKRPLAESIQFLEIMRDGTAESRLTARIERNGASGLRLAAIPGEMNLPQKEVQDLVDKLTATEKVIRGDRSIFSLPELNAAKENALAVLNEFHRQNPLVSGISNEDLRSRLRLGEELFAIVLRKLIQENKIDIAAEIVHLSGRGVVLKDDEAQSKNIIENAFASGGLAVPALKDVLASLRIDRAHAQKLVTLLLRDKVLVKVSDELIFHRNSLDGLRRKLTIEKAKSPKIDVARFKELTGVSRKYAIPLLEYLDREHITRREGSNRTIL